MKNTLLSLIFGMILCISVSAQNDPWVVGKTTFVNKTNDNEVDSWVRGISIGNQEIKVYQSAANDDLPKNHGAQYVNYLYFYEIPYEITSVRVGEASSKTEKNAIEVSLSPLSIDKTLVYNWIKENLNGWVKRENVLPLKMRGYKLAYSGVSSDSEVSTVGIGMREEVSNWIKFQDRASAQAALKSIKLGSPLKFEYLTFKKSSVTNSGEVKVKSKQIAEAQKQFISPIIGKTIWLFHNHLNKRVITKTWDIKIVESSPSATFNDIVMSALANYKMVDIPFSDASEKLVDFNGHRFQTDELNALAYDAKNMSNAEWCNKMQKTFETSQSSSRSKDGSGGGSFEYFGIGGSANGSYSSSNAQQEELKRLLNTEDCGKQYVENSFNYQQNGRKFTPKSIKAVEYIHLSSASEEKRTVTHIVKDQWYGSTIRVVRLRGK